MVKEHEFYKIFANNLRRIMHERDKTQADMARDLHVGKSRVSSWMNGQHIPRPEMVDKICDYLNCSRSDLMTAKTDKKTRSVSKEQAELIQLIMTANPEHIHLVLEILKRLEKV